MLVTVSLDIFLLIVLQKRRRTHGYAIFSSEMRKKITTGIPLSETTKIIAEKWRTASQHIRQAYEARAAAINESENRKFQNLLVQTQRRQQQMQMQQAQQRKQQLMLQHQQQRQAIRERLYPGTSSKLNPFCYFGRWFMSEMIS